MGQLPARRESDASVRLLTAATQMARVEGASGLTVQGIATEAGVSKALVLYHFRDKDELVARLVGWLTRRVVEREHATLVASTAGTVMEDLWRWLDHELRLGELRVLVELGCPGSTAQCDASAESISRRLEAAEQTLTRVFSILDLPPRVSVALVAQVHEAFVSGMAVMKEQQPSANHRLTYDVFWLALLNLAE
jgi:AcrR family transcriptional regulator